MNAPLIHTPSVYRKPSVYLSLVGLLLVAALWLYAEQHGTFNISRSSEWVHYRNETFGYEINYPLGWDRYTFTWRGNRNYREERLRLNYDAYSPKGTITLQQRRAYNFDSEKVAAWGYDLMVEDFDVTRSTLETLSYGEHQYLTRIYKVGDVTIHDVYIARPDDALILRILSSEEELSGMLPLFQRVVAEFKPQ